MFSAWRFERSGWALDFGRPRHELREIMNAVLYVDRTGCRRAHLPHDFPPWQSASATSPTGRGRYFTQLTAPYANFSAGRRA